MHAGSLEAHWVTRPEAVGLEGTKFFTALRKGQAIPAGEKLLIVLDQFEQWLQANSGKEKTELVAALRRCDGKHVQTIILVRDDFWTATTRFSMHAHVKFDPDSN